MECSKCKSPTTLSDYDGSQCSHCKLVLCRRCDDSSNLLQWWGTDPTDRDGTDLYLCDKCLAKHTGTKKPRKKKALPVENSGVLSGEKPLGVVLIDANPPP
jgi:hypothetical protein